MNIAQIPDNARQEKNESGRGNAGRRIGKKTKRCRSAARYPAAAENGRGRILRNPHAAFPGVKRR
jgi:hypothetical protein